MSRPVIGVAMQCLEAVPGRLPACWVMGQRYVRALTDAGAAPWLIPALPDEDTLRAALAREIALLTSDELAVLHRKPRLFDRGVKPAVGQPKRHRGVIERDRRRCRGVSCLHALPLGSWWRRMHSALAAAIQPMP